MNNPFKKWLALVPLKAVLVAALFVLSALLFGWIAHEVLLDPNDLFDQRAHNFFLQYSSPGVLKVMKNLTVVGSFNFLFPAYLLLISFFLVKKRYRKGIEIAVIALSSFGVMQGLKQLFHRKRPEGPVIRMLPSYSFPSGHALSAFIFCSILGYLIWKGNLSLVWKVTLIVLLLVLAITIGISRIVLNVHYATDVIAGFCLGVMWVIGAFWIMRKRVADR